MENEELNDEQLDKISGGINWKGLFTIVGKVFQKIGELLGKIN